MALFDNEIDKSLHELIKQWNVAERRIKKAEQVRGNEVVASAIFELRYAGRKIIDVIQLALDADIIQNNDNKLKAITNIADATEDCVKAKHDAIDAMLDFIARWFDDVEGKLSLTKINEFFPDYLNTLEKIVVIQDKIAESRQNRTNGRDGIYDDIENNGYDQILTLYNSMNVSQNRIEAEIKKERRSKLYSRIWNGVMGLVAIGSLYYGWAATQNAANSPSTAVIQNAPELPPQP